METNHNIIKDRRHPTLKSNEDIYRLTKDSYIGGYHYINQKYLYQYYKEHKSSYRARVARATHINHVQPLSDTLNGFLFQELPVREVEKDAEYLIEKAGYNMDLDSLMKSVALQSFFYPVLVLVDSPNFNPEEIITEADKKESQVQPYCTIYRFDEIRDYSFNSKGELEWILLDDSYVKKEIFKKDKKIKKYKLWTKDYYQTFEFESDEHGSESCEASEEINHDLGAVPASFAGWGNLINNDTLKSSAFENIALLSRSIYNLLSCMDEVLYSGSFKTLAFPVKNKDDLPKQILKHGVGAIPIMTFNGDLSQVPFYLQAGMEDLSNFFNMIKLLTKEIFSQVGLTDPENENRYKESGISKSIQFRNTSAILSGIASSLEKLEMDIFSFAGLWEDKEYKVSIKYNNKFNVQDLDEELSRLYQLLSMPYQTLQKYSTKRIVQKTLKSSGAEKEEIDPIIEEIENTNQEEFDLENISKNKNDKEK